MNRFIEGLENVIEIVFAVVKVIIAFAILLWLADKIFELKLNIIKLNFINNISSKELTALVVLLLVWLGFKDTKRK